MSARKEPDEVEYLSGLFEGKTTGTPIAFIIRNKDAKTSDYENIKDVFRPSHADFTYQMKYGIRDYAGGGRGSARTLLPCVVAGAIAKQILAMQGIEISSEVVEMGEVREKDTVGAIIQGTIKNAPVGLGEPAFMKFHAILAYAMMTINAAKGFEIGEGFNAARMRGSECNDEFTFDGERIRTKTNHSGGVQGGITNGEDIVFRVAFKPIPSVMLPQQTVDIQGNPVTLLRRHGHPCRPLRDQAAGLPVDEGQAVRKTLRRPVPLQYRRPRIFRGGDPSRHETVRYQGLPSHRGVQPEIPRPDLQFPEGVLRPDGLLPHAGPRPERPHLH